MKKQSSLFVCALAFCAVLGCGPGKLAVEPVTGKITVDGEVVPGLGIRMVLEDDQATNVPLAANTDDQGNFEIGGPGGVKGAPIGSYLLTLSEPPSEFDYDTGKPTASSAVKLPEYCKNPAAPDCPKVEVVAGGTTVTLDIKTN